MTFPEIADFLFLAAVGSVHLIDSFFTVKILQVKARDYENPEVFEINYHRVFFRRYGLLKGVRLSLIISMTFVMTVTLGSMITLGGYDCFPCGLIIGLLTVPAYLNAMTYLRYYYQPEEDAVPIPKQALIDHEQKLRDEYVRQQQGCEE